MSKCVCVCVCVRKRSKSTSIHLYTWLYVCARVWLSLVVYPSVSFCFIVTKIALCSWEFERSLFKIPRLLYYRVVQHGWEQGVIADFLNNRFLSEIWSSNMCNLWSYLSVSVTCGVYRGAEPRGMVMVVAK